MIALTIDPQNADILYAGTNVGLFKSVDSGESWTGLNAGLPALPVGPGTVTNLPVYVVAVDPRNPATIYVSGSDVFYIDGRLACCASALFKSTDGGATWNTLSVPVSARFPAAIPPLSALVIDRDNPNTLYATRFCNCALMKSTDGGGTWQDSGPTFPDSSTIMPMLRITVDASAPKIFYAQTSAGFMKSTDGGEHWTTASLPSNFSASRIAADAGRVYVAASSSNLGSGLFKSTDAGENWNNVTRGLSTAGITAIVVDPANPNTIYAGGNGVVMSIDAGSTWTDEKADFVPLTLAIEPHNPRTLYAGTWDGEAGSPVSVFTSRDAGSTWNAAVSSFSANGSGMIQSVAVDPYNSDLIFAGTSQGLFKSTDGGANWDALDKFAGTYIRSIVFDPLTSGILYVGTYGGGVWKSTDGGVNWEPAGLFNGAVLAIDPQNPKILYAAISYPTMGVFKTVDAGHSWSAAGTSGLPPDANLVGALVIDPKNLNTLYLATSGALLDSCFNPCSGLNDGVFGSKDGGASWFAVNFGLTTPHVYSLAIDPQNTNTLYAGTLGGGVFSITFAPTPIVSGLRFDRSSVVEGASYVVTFGGQNLASETFFDVQFTAPDGSSDIALNWQQGAIGSHDAVAGTAVGSWTITGVRPHDFEADHSGNFFAVSATIAIGRQR